MTLAIDIGNSNIVIALYKEGQWTNTFRYETKETQPEFYYENALRNILLEWRISSSNLTKCIISSVVPDLNEVIRQAVNNISGCEPLFITPDVLKNLDVAIPHPYEIGSDIAANAYASIKLHGDHNIIIDFGTALTFTVANKKDGIIGVTIAPGIMTAIHALSSNTAQLPTVPLHLPASAIGHDTVSAIQSGVLWGYVGLVKEVVYRIQNELPTPYKIIATGGLSSILHPLEDTIDMVDKMLTLDGMRLIYEFHTTKNKI